MVLILAYFVQSRNLQRIPRGKQIWAEVVVEFAYKLVSGAMGRHNMLTFAPYFGTVIIFILFSNMLGLFGLRPEIGRAHV